jgi:hypothetical protein
LDQIAAAKSQVLILSCPTPQFDDAGRGGSAAAAGVGHASGWTDYPAYANVLCSPVNNRAAAVLAWRLVRLARLSLGSTSSHTSVSPSTQCCCYSRPWYRRRAADINLIRPWGLGRNPTAPIADAARKTRHTDAADGRRSNARPIRSCPLSLNAVAWALSHNTLTRLPGPSSGRQGELFKSSSGYRGFSIGRTGPNTDAVSSSDVCPETKGGQLRRKSERAADEVHRKKTNACRRERRPEAAACRTFKFLAKGRRRKYRRMGEGKKVQPARNPGKRQLGGGGGKRTNLTYPMGPRPGPFRQPRPISESDN